MTALAVAKQKLQRREAASPRALAVASERQGKAMFVVPEVISSPFVRDTTTRHAACLWQKSLVTIVQLCTVQHKRARVYGKHAHGYLCLLDSLKHGAYCEAIWRERHSILRTIA